MRKITVEAVVTYSVAFDTEVEVPDDFNEKNVTSAMEMLVSAQVREAAFERVDPIAVEDVDWYIK